MEEKFSYGNVMSVPNWKVIISCGFGKLVTNKTRDEQRNLFSMLKIMQAICGQTGYGSGKKIIYL